MSSYYESLQRDPDESLALLRVAQLQLDRNRPEAALARLERLMELRPTDPEVRLRRGRAFLALHQIPEAVADLEFAATRLPDRPDVMYQLALAREQSRDIQSAVIAANRAAELAPDSAAARNLAERLRR
jgi:cytochrome c-type biogenesis protein CcmH